MADKVYSNPLLLHEYGHTFDSEMFGPGYLFGVGIPSAASAGFKMVINTGGMR